MNHAIRITCAVVLALSGASAQVVRTVVQNGPSDELYDMVFLGDGYTAADQAQFDQDVIAVVDHFRNTPDKFPYGAYFGLYNVHSVFRASNQRGADKPPLGIFVDTAYDASYWTGGTERCLYIGDTALAANDAALAPDTDGRVIVLVNDSKYGGCAGTFSVGYNGASMAEVQAHEWGHSFAGLADEYDYGRSGSYSGPEPASANITRDPSGALKWAPWLGHGGPHGTVGAYQGAGYYTAGLYRPEPDCEMRTLGRNFCTVCREQMIKRFHQECGMFDAPTPSPVAAHVGGTAVVSFGNRLAGRPHRIEWRVDGGAWQTGGASFQWNVGAAALGPHTIDVRLTDTSPEVRQDPGGLLVHLHSWRVDVAAPPLHRGLAEVLPAAAAGVEGDASTTRPFGAGVAQRVMYAYARAAGRSPVPLHVAGVAFRADGGAPSHAGASWDLSLDVSTSRHAPTALARSFDDNHGADRVRAHDGVITAPAASFGSPPAPFTIVVPFDEPFAWNPRSGPLLLDFRLRSASGAALTADAANAAAGELACIAHDSDPNALVASFPPSGTQPLGLVVELILDAEVAPPAFATAEGPASSAIGLPVPAAQRLMEIRDAATFGLGGRHLVTALAWRAEAGAPWPAGRSYDLEVELSTGPANLSSTAVTAFEQNHGADRRVVFDGTWTPPASSGGSPAPFALRLDLERPFAFDPAHSSLVVDLRIRSVTGGAGASVDAAAPGGTRTLWAYRSSHAQQAGVDLPDTAVLALLAVPQPVLPESADGAPGGITLSRPWGAAGGGRSMTAYDAATLGVAEPVEITHLAWRLAAGPSRPVTFDARVDLSSGGLLPLGGSFASNHGSDRATVFDAAFSAARGASAEFVVELKLDTPFRWDPARGPLVVDVRKRGELGSSTPSLDAVAGAAFSFAAHTSDPDAATADRPVAARAPVLRLGGTIGANGLATPFGAGCGGPGAVPVAGSIGLPWLGNAGFELALFDARPSASAAMLFGLAQASTPLDPLGFPGCTMLVGTMLGDVGTSTDPTGAARSAAGLPDDPALQAAVLTTQWLVLDPAGVNGIATSDGLRLTLR